MSDLEVILVRLGLSQYLEALVEEGFDTWETVLDVTEEDLEKLNFKLGHRRVGSLYSLWLHFDERSQAKVLSEMQLNKPLHANQFRQTDDGGDHDDKSPPRSAQTENPGAQPNKQGTGKRKYRRHPKPDDNAPERPSSAYVMFANRVRDELKGQNLSFTEIAKLVGERWKVLNPADKEHFEFEATMAKERYAHELAEYKKTDSYKEYLSYLTEFKNKMAKDGSEVAETCRKRAKLESVSSASAAAGSSTNTRNSSISSPNTYASGSASSPQRVPGPGSTPASVATSGRHSVSPILQQLPSIARSYRDGIIQPQQYEPEPLTPTSVDEGRQLPKLQTTLSSVYGNQIQQTLSNARNQPSRTPSSASTFSHGSSTSLPIRRRSMMENDSFTSGGSSMSLPSVSSFDDARGNNLRLPPPNIPNQPISSQSSGYFERSPRAMPQSHIFSSVGPLQTSSSGASPTSMIPPSSLSSNPSSAGMGMAVESGNPSGHNASIYSPYNSNERYSSNPENASNQ